MDDPILILREHQARDFLLASQRCSNPESGALTLPSIICASISAELGLKTLLARHGIAYEREHSLRKLLELLPGQERQDVIRETSKKFPNFEAELDKAHKAFVE